MKITLVVPLRNEEKSLGDLVAGINGQTRPPDEIVLVDGGSTDRTASLARELTRHDPRFRVVGAGPATPGRGRNVGIAAATHDWVALTDAGIQLEPTWLERLAAVAVSRPQVDVVYGNFEPITRSFFERCAALAYVSPRQVREGTLMRGPSIASALLRRSVWRVVGGFPDLRASEDLFFMERVQREGYTTGWAHQATVWWQLQPTLGRTFRKFMVYSKHNAWAGRQRDWHYPLARKYLAALPFVALAVAHNPWWAVVPALGAAARVARSIARRREGRGLGWLLNPVQFAGVGLILAAIDVAAVCGWAQAAWPRRSPAAVAVHASNEA